MKEKKEFNSSELRNFNKTSESQTIYTKLRNYLENQNTNLDLPQPPDYFFSSSSQFETENIHSTFPPPPLNNLIKQSNKFIVSDQFAENRKAYLNDINCNFKNLL